MRGARAEVVYHLAAQIDVRESVRDPSADALVNVGGTVAVLEAARRAGVGRVILVSTAAVYGDPPRGSHHRDGSSRAALALRRRQGRRRDLRGSLQPVDRHVDPVGATRERLRPATGSARRGGRDLDLLRSGRGATSAIIYGDGTQTRDYVYVGDVAHALRPRAAHASRAPSNLSTGTETPLTAVAGHLDLDVVRAPERAGELKHSCLDPTRAERELGWRAETSLPEGLERTLDAVRGSLVPNAAAA